MAYAVVFETSPREGQRLASVLRDGPAPLLFPLDTPVKWRCPKLAIVRPTASTIRQLAVPAAPYVEAAPCVSSSGGRRWEGYADDFLLRLHTVVGALDLCGPGG